MNATKYSNFSKTVPDMRSRKSMSEYLLKHWRYGMDFCNNVKIHNLSIPTQFRESVYAALEIPELYDILERDLFKPFRAQYGNGSPENICGGVGNVYVGFEGRSGGYLVLYGAEPDQDYANWDMSDLRHTVRIVIAFDKLCDAAVTEFVELAIETE